jgi:hypothetical protein
MKTTALAVILVSAVAVATAVAPDLAWAQPECTEVWFQLEDPLHDPPCGIEGVSEDWAIRVTTSPSSTSAGSCTAGNLDNRYTSVEFFSDGCELSQPEDTCTIVATESILSGDYLIQDVEGACFMVCQPCP